MPKYAAVFLVMALASIGLPGTSGFVGEFLILVGTFQIHTGTAILATIGIILGAAYMLWLYRRVIFGPLIKDDVRQMVDLEARELMIFIPLIVVILWLGLYPASVLTLSATSVEQLIEGYFSAVALRHP